MPNNEQPNLPYTPAQIDLIAELVNLYLGGCLWQHLGLKSEFAYWDMLAGRLAPAPSALAKLAQYDRDLVAPHMERDRAYWAHRARWGR